jgi:para-aminobenzoate synthetase component I
MATNHKHQVSSRDEFRSLAKAVPTENAFIWLDSQLPGHPASEQSFLFTDFRAVLSFDRGVALISDSQGQVQERINSNDPWQILTDFRKRYPGYLVGYLGYDLKNYSETLKSENPDPVLLPEMWFGSPQAIYRQIVDSDCKPQQVEREKPGLVDIQLDSMISPQEYVKAVRDAQKAIYEGDIYEVNLSHQLRASFSGDPLDLYEMMCQRGPVPYASFLRINNVHICCASPELFLRKSGRKLFSDPIKGTRARGKSEQEDQEILQELNESTKDRAENLMIVDLVRHDMSQISEPGSVQVPRLFDIQTFGTVHQMVSRVQAELRDDVSPEEALRACFPMGSMTGAPKIRAMEYIEKLENYRRGLYSGAIGFFDPAGDFSFNVVIRSAIVKGEKLWYSAGGAITSDSDPQQEWEETLVKIRALGV